MLALKHVVKGNVYGKWSEKRAVVKLYCSEALFKWWLHYKCAYFVVEWMTCLYLHNRLFILLFTSIIIVVVVIVFIIIIIFVTSSSLLFFNLPYICRLFTIRLSFYITLSVIISSFRVQSKWETGFRNDGCSHCREASKGKCVFVCFELLKILFTRSLAFPHQCVPLSPAKHCIWFIFSQDFKPKGNPLKYRILENSVLMASKTKPNVEKALSQFMEIATTEVL